MSALDASWQVLKDMGQDEAYERTWGRPPGEIGSAPAEESSVPFKPTPQVPSEHNRMYNRMYNEGYDHGRRNSPDSLHQMRNQYQEEQEQRWQPSPTTPLQLTPKELSDMRNKYWKHIKGKVKGAMPTIPSMFRRNHPNEPQESVDARRRASGDSGKWLPGESPQSKEHESIFDPRAVLANQLRRYSDREEIERRKRMRGL